MGFLVFLFPYSRELLYFSEFIEKSFSTKLQTSREKRGLDSERRLAVVYVIHQQHTVFLVLLQKQLLTCILLKKLTITMNHHLHNPSFSGLFFLDHNHSSSISILCRFRFFMKFSLTLSHCSASRHNHLRTVDGSISNTPAIASSHIPFIDILRAKSIIVPFCEEQNR